MRLILPFEEIGERDAPLVGGKALALARLAKAGVDVPRSGCWLSARCGERRPCAPSREGRHSQSYRSTRGNPPLGKPQCVFR
jgi:hypothetical protein